MTMAIREAVPGDERAVARVHVTSWREGYRGLLPDAYLDGLSVSTRAAGYRFADRHLGAPRTLLAVDGRDVLGFATYAAPARPEPGLLDALYVDPGRWGTGVGRLLIEAARARLHGAGCRTAELWVLLGNARAIRFYERDGWTATGRRRREQRRGIAFDVLGYRRPLP